jgi:hypothetical protein
MIPEKISPDYLFYLFDWRKVLKKSPFGLLIGYFCSTASSPSVF